MKRVKKICANPNCKEGKTEMGEPCRSCQGTGYVWTYEKKAVKVFHTLSAQNI